MENRKRTFVFAWLLRKAAEEKLKVLREAVFESLGTFEYCVTFFELNLNSQSHTKLCDHYLLSDTSNHINCAVT